MPVTRHFWRPDAGAEQRHRRASVLVLQMVAIGLVFYFLILRPSGQARKRHAELLAKLKKGDEVMTSGGIIGRVKDIKEVRARAPRRPGDGRERAPPPSWSSARGSSGSAASAAPGTPAA